MDREGGQEWEEGARNEGTQGGGGRRRGRGRGGGGGGGTQED